MIVRIISITIIDYKSGSMRGLRQKYDEQLKCYTKIMGKRSIRKEEVEYYMLFR